MPRLLRTQARRRFGFTNARPVRRTSRPSKLPCTMDILSVKIRVAVRLSSHGRNGMEVRFTVSSAGAPFPITQPVFLAY